MFGSFGLSNYDRTAEVAGAQSSGSTAFLRRPSNASHFAPADDRPPSVRRRSSDSRHALTRSTSMPTIARMSSAASLRLKRRPTMPAPGVDNSRISSELREADPGAVAEVPEDSDLQVIGEGVATEEAEKAIEKERPDTSSSEEKESIMVDMEVAKLARTLTNKSSWSHVADNPFMAEKGSSLDPDSENFRAREWTKSMLKLQRAEGNLPERTAGFAFRDLNVFGYGAETDYQKSVGNIWLSVFGAAKTLLGLAKPRRIDILRDFEGIVESGEMLVVLGPPGSGCTTFLKTISGETNGFYIGDESYVNYQGIPYERMHKRYKGEAIYTAEVDVHFPNLSVGDTLDFAARARAPRMIPGGFSTNEWVTHMRQVIMATFGISHTVNTQVGNDFVRGVSGGERKRVTIAEAALSGAPLQCWDNSTRGLDSANAIEFCRNVRVSTELRGSAAAVAIYQAPQTAYDIFDKALVLYDGRQIYFGPTTNARGYFERLGFDFPDRQTDADFLTSMTSPQERVVREGWEKKAPRSPDEFAAAWKASPERAELKKQLDAYEQSFPFLGESYERFEESRRAEKSKHQRPASPYTLSYAGQVLLCLRRGFQRLRGDPSLTFTQLFGNAGMALILGSVFYQVQDNTAAFFQRGAVLFFAILINAFGSALEILTLYAQRPIVEKHDRYAFYHPSAEAFASMLTDMPYKIANTIIFNIALYFMVGLRQEPGAFFFFMFISFISTLTMSMFFRTLASVSRTLSQAMAPSAILILAIIIFTGFAIPVNYMLGWCRWINWVDPIAYAFECLMINEFAGRRFTCSQFVPPYGSIEDGTAVCSAVGSVEGQTYVEGTAYIESSYRYIPSHRWRNVGIIFAFMIFLMMTYLGATEAISAKKSKGEVLLFRRGHKPAALKAKTEDEESGVRDANALVESKTEATDVIQKQTAIFAWRNVCYDIKIKKEDRRILDHVDGWVKPGTLTALMGVSGAGKTTLLDVLATRVTMGVVSGQMLVDGRQRDESFQRKTGYVQQQDLHLQTTTVREALNFSALLRQPRSVSRQEKLAYVDDVISLLDMEEYADAVVGVPGEGLNVEQRKRLTIGVELAAKPELLLFLDEPTSGLDSQTSWAILDLLEKLKNSGQAILCTIHQPSAMLFQRFDRLLFLAKGGKTVYFGEIGENSRTLANYFESNGGHKCPDNANPAEWMLEVIGAAPGSYTDIDWHQTWRNSKEYLEVQNHLDFLKEDRLSKTKTVDKTADKDSYREFAAPFGAQTREVLLRVFQQYWRTPSYIYSKILLCTSSALFIGFIFYNAPLSQQGLQNQMFSLFLLFTIFGQLVQQIMPHFVTQRALYEVRERPAKTYSWQSFMFSNIVVELPWNTLMAVIIFFCIYYPVGFYRNAEPTNAVTERGALFFLFVLEFLLFTSTFTNMVIAGVSDAETGGNIANFMFSMCLIFCGVLATPESLPGFWIFMYRISPFTYLVSGMLGTAIANQRVTCADNEYVSFNAPTGQTCREYLGEYIELAGGYLRENDTSQCTFCTFSSTNTFLESISTSYDVRWRNFGIMWVFIIFNLFAALGLYWLARVPKNQKKKMQEKESEDA